MTKEEYGKAYQRGFNLTVRFLVSRGLSYDAALDTAQAAWAKGWERREQLRDPNLKATPAIFGPRDHGDAAVVRDVAFVSGPRAEQVQRLLHGRAPIRRGHAWQRQHRCRGRHQDHLSCASELSRTVGHAAPRSKDVALPLGS